MAIYFYTPTVLPIEAVTTMAIHAKPNSDSPLGFFGTGLKYAVAIVIRLGGEIKFTIDGVEYVFYTNPSDFRGTTVHHVRMKKRKGVLSSWRYEKLPFTTDLGKNWEPWQAFRELYTNTLDEGGHTTTEEPADKAGSTIIEVKCPEIEKFADPDYLHEVYFTGEGREIVYEDDSIAVYEGVSKHLYYRGVRVMDVPAHSWYTYVIKRGVILSEDRSIKNQYDIQALIAATIDKLDYKRIRDLFEHEGISYETHHLTYYHLREQKNSKLVAYVNSNPNRSFGYYVGALKIVDPVDDEHNFDVSLSAEEMFETLDSFVDDPYQSNPLMNMFVNWIVNNNHGDMLKEYAERNELVMPQWVFTHI